MTTNGASRIIGAMSIAAIASCINYANAQTSVGAPPDAAVQVLKVATSPPGTRPNSSVIRDVRLAIRRVPDLDDSQIHIRASHGVVTLTGRVAETWQISRAGNAARSVRGVRAVTNRLEVHDEGSGH